MPRCRICRHEYALITNTHLGLHGWTLKQYMEDFGVNGVGFLRPNLLSKTDQRFKQWRLSLKKRPPPWSKGYTKATHPSIEKISATMRRKRIDNFRAWRDQARLVGIIPAAYPPLPRSGDLGELIGVVLGDGHIAAFPRTERITICSNANNPGFVKRYAALLQKIFHKEPLIRKTSGSQCIRISLYQRWISRRLGIPTGARKEMSLPTPRWILNKRVFLIRYLRGLYEAEGSFCVHRPTSTYKLFFSNRNGTLLHNVHRGMSMLGFHPHQSKYMVQISRKTEVYAAIKLIQFRVYK